jgi:L,D-transpeptidase YcbB
MATRCRCRIGIVTLALVAAFAGCNRGRPGTAAGTAGARADVQRLVEGRTRPVFVSADKEGERLRRQTREFYQARQFEPAWVDGTSPRGEMDELIGALQHADREGLDPALYNASGLAARRAEAGRGFLTKQGFQPAEAATLDVWLTYLYLQYASDLADGLSDLSHADPSWKIKPEPFDARKHLEEALQQNRVGASLSELTSRDPEYAALRDALGHYRDLAAKGGWPRVPDNLRLKPGQHSPAVPAVAKRLAATGDFTGSANADETAYGPDLQEAVKRFQRRHGLEPDAAIGAAVVREMNLPVEARVQQLQLNLERWRWLPRDLGPRHILVNVPEFRLEVWDHDRVPLAMRVVVGKKDTPTPIFADEMTQVIFSPYWNVPPSIAQKETLPAVMRDPAFLERTNMEVIDASGHPVDPQSIDLDDPGKYRFRQRPGTSNSLGLVKFVFPNQYDVYFHDTPADSLFARATRSLSHGCVRLEQPTALAQYVLQDQPEWTPERIDAAMHAGEEKVVKLREPIPVYIGYWTARVTPDKLVQFRADVYDIDARLAAKLADRIAHLKARAAAAATVALRR